MDPDNVKVYEHKADLVFNQKLADIRSAVTHDKGAYLFDTNEFLGQDFGNDLAAHRLPEEELIRYGELATKLREGFKKKSEHLERAEFGANHDQEGDIAALEV